jgi:hypothetical protein
MRYANGSVVNRVAPNVSKSRQRNAMESLEVS